MDEKELIHAAQRGDIQAFNRLVLFYQDAVYTQAYRILGEPQTAEDVAQEAFISAHHNLASYHGSGTFRGWLMRITTNLCLDELRREKRRPTVALEPTDRDGDELESPRWMADPDGSPEEAVERVELRDVIQRSLDELSPNLKAVVVMVDLQGMDYGEASTALGVPLGTVKSRLARARERLRQGLLVAWNPAEPAYAEIGVEATSCC